MFCNQCEETFNGVGCTVMGLCGKTQEVANLQDILLYLLKGISIVNRQAREKGINTEETDKFVIYNLYATITNSNFNRSYFIKKIKDTIKLRDKIKRDLALDDSGLHDSVKWSSDNEREYQIKSEEVREHSTEDGDIRSLKELLLYGIKGISAYTTHAYELGYKDDDVCEFMQQVLIATISDNFSSEGLKGLVLKCGEYGIKAMRILDEAHTSTYGNPEPTNVNINVGKTPGILISGHSLKDLEELLEQTKGTGVDVYTHGEMLPANSYPFFKKFKNFIGNYGCSWWKQKEEFKKFNGPILMTTNCLVPPRESYKNRVYTTGIVGCDGLKHIDKQKAGESKNFSEIIEHAKRCSPPERLEEGTIMCGFAHNAVLSVIDKIIAAVKSGKIRRFIVMAGCDGRHKERRYYTEFANALPKDTVILTAGCAKYRYNKLSLGEIDGIPRVLDAGQCNDSYSLIVIAKKLVDAFGLKDINELPISYNLAWYEQKAVLVFLALLSIGVKNIRLGPNLPAFLSLKDWGHQLTQID